MLGNFCDVNGVEEKEIVQAIDYYNNAETYVEDHNEEFLARAMVEEKEYLDNVLKAVDPVVVLDEDQRKVVLTDEDYCLVIAGAGAGKTTTVAAKVKYLVDKKGIDPAQILVVSFTNKAVNELKEKIQDDLGVPCPIATFHSTGNAIIHKNSPEEKLNIVDNSKLYFVIRDYFRGSVMKNESVVNKLIMFFATYFDAPYEGDDLNGFFNNIAKANYSTMRSDLEDFKREVIDTRTKKSVTIQNEILRSHQEVEIANFLYLNNIEYLKEYDYEGIYTRLEKTEGPFVDLENYLDSYKKKKSNVRNADWAYSDSDISDLKLVCFDYIRARYEGKEFRDIAKTGKDGSIFFYKDLWEAFLHQHEVNTPVDAKTVEELRLEYPNEDLSILLKKRDNEWIDSAKGQLKGNLQRFSRKLEDKRASNKPGELIERALSALQAVDCEQDSFTKDPHIEEMVREINKLTYEMKKILERR